MIGSKQKHEHSDRKQNTNKNNKQNQTVTFKNSSLSILMLSSSSNILNAMLNDRWDLVSRVIRKTYSAYEIKPLWPSCRNIVELPFLKGGVFLIILLTVSAFRTFLNTRSLGSSRIKQSRKSCGVMYSHPLNSTEAKSRNLCCRLGSLTSESSSSLRTFTG